MNGSAPKDVEVDEHSGLYVSEPEECLEGVDGNHQQDAQDVLAKGDLGIAESISYRNTTQRQRTRNAMQCHAMPCHAMHPQCHFISFHFTVSAKRVIRVSENDNEGRGHTRIVHSNVAEVRRGGGHPQH